MPRDTFRRCAQRHILWALLCDVISKLAGGLVPPRLVSFVGVGLIGSSRALLHASMPAWRLGSAFWLSQALATVTAMVFNFTINNILTYPTTRLSERRLLQGPAALQRHRLVRHRGECQHGPAHLRAFQGPYLHRGLHGHLHRRDLAVRGLEPADLGKVLRLQEDSVSARQGLICLVAAVLMLIEVAVLPSRGLFLLAGLPTALMALVFVHRDAGRRGEGVGPLLYGVGILSAIGGYCYLALAPSGALSPTDEVIDWGRLDKRPLIFGYLGVAAFIASLALDGLRSGCAGHRASNACRRGTQMADAAPGGACHRGSRLLLVCLAGAPQHRRQSTAALTRSTTFTRMSI